MLVDVIVTAAIYVRRETTLGRMNRNFAAATYQTLAEAVEMMSLPETVALGRALRVLATDHPR